LPSQSLLLITLTWLYIYGSEISFYPKLKRKSILQFLVTFAQFRIGANSLQYLSFDTSVRLEQICSNWKKFYEVQYWKLECISVEKFKFGYNLKRIVFTLHEDLLKCMITSCCILLAMRNILFKMVEVNKKARFMFSNLFHENHNIMW
jgi:hypothetical protein